MLRGASQGLTFQVKQAILGKTLCCPSALTNEQGLMIQRKHKALPKCLTVA